MYPKRQNVMGFFSLHVSSFFLLFLISSLIAVHICHQIRGGRNSFPTIIPATFRPPCSSSSSPSYSICSRWISSLFTFFFYPFSACASYLPPNSRWTKLILYHNPSNISSTLFFFFFFLFFFFFFFFFSFLLHLFALDFFSLHVSFYFVSACASYLPPNSRWTKLILYNNPTNVSSTLFFFFFFLFFFFFFFFFFLFLFSFFFFSSTSSSSSSFPSSSSSFFLSSSFSYLFSAWASYLPPKPR